MLPSVVDQYVQNLKLPEDTLDTSNQLWTNTISRYKCYNFTIRSFDLQDSNKAIPQHRDRIEMAQSTRCFSSHFKSPLERVQNRLVLKLNMGLFLGWNSNETRFQRFRNSYQLKFKHKSRKICSYRVIHVLHCSCPILSLKGLSFLTSCLKIKTHTIT